MSGNLSRRHFSAVVAGMAAAGLARSATTPRFFLMGTFQPRQGDEVTRMHDFPSLEFVLEAVVAPHTPQLLAIAGVRNSEDLRIAQATLGSWLGSDAVWNTDVLEAAAYSREAPAGRTERHRYFELRRYRSHSWSQLDALHLRFTQAEAGIFQRSGIYPMFHTSNYTGMLTGPQNPKLTYLIPFDSLAAREKSWAAFGADPEWIEARKESIDQYGQIASVSDISIYRATHSTIS